VDKTKNAHVHRLEDVDADRLTREGEGGREGWKEREREGEMHVPGCSCLTASRSAFENMTKEVAGFLGAPSALACLFFRLLLVLPSGLLSTGGTMGAPGIMAWNGYGYP